MKCYSSREILKILQQDGWCKEVTIPHPKKDIPFKTAKSILDQAGLKLE